MNPPHDIPYLYTCAINMKPLLKGYEVDEIVNELWMWEQKYGGVTWQSAKWCRISLHRKMKPIKAVECIEDRKQESLAFYDYWKMLKDKQKEVILPFLDGLNCEQIGKQMGVSGSCVTMRIRNATKRRRKLERIGL